MTDTQDTNSRIDGDRPTPEPSPSAGWRETAALMNVTPGLKECDVLGCDRDGDPVRVLNGDTDTVREGVRCSGHAKGFLEVTS
jgi:hypothetical protein